MTATIEQLRTKAGMSIKDLAVSAGLTYNEAYAAEKYEGVDIKRNRAKHERNQQLLREHLTLHLDGQEREQLARRLKHAKLSDDENLDALREKAQADFVRRMTFAPVGWSKEAEWEGFKSGDRIQISGEDTVFIFLCHTITANDHHWVDCYGGDEFRSFRVERVVH
jgi:hypothetical protein